MYNITVCVSLVQKRALSWTHILTEVGDEPDEPSLFVPIKTSFCWISNWMI